MFVVSCELWQRKRGFQPRIIPVDFNYDCASCGSGLCLGRKLLCATKHNSAVPGLTRSSISPADSIAPVLLNPEFREGQRAERSIFFFAGPERLLAKALKRRYHKSKEDEEAARNHQPSYQETGFQQKLQAGSRINLRQPAKEIEQIN